MNITEKLERSKSQEKIDFSKIACLNQQDPLVLVRSSEKIVVEPIWQKADDFEGRMYAAYRADHPEYDGVYVRSELLKRLEKAANSLSEPYKLVIRAGHRPLAVQKRLLHDAIQDYKDEHADASNEEALQHARLYVSDPAIKLPPHCCGAAVDVELLDAASGRYVDFGSPLNEDSARSHLHFNKITPQQEANRLLLIVTMLKAGFSSYYPEWWHYSYGDEVWAWFYHKDTCLYGLVEIN